MSTSLGNGTIVFGDGTSQASAYSGRNMRIFTSGATSWTVPAGVTSIRVIAFGGGGGGGSSYNQGANNAGAGGRGGVVVGWVTVTGGSTYTVTVGTGGTGVTSYNAGGAGGTAGGSTTIGSVMTATGGGGGYGYKGGGYSYNGSDGSGSLTGTAWFTGGGVSSGFAELYGAGYRDFYTFDTSPAAWSAGSGYMPGAGGGAGWSGGGPYWAYAVGGVGGMVLVEW